MTSLDRLRQAMNPSEKGRSPVLPSEAVKASLGEYGLSAADQLLSSAGFGVEVNSGGSGLESITNPEIRAEFEKDLATYEQIFAGAGIKIPTPGELSAAGIDWVHLAELKETRPNHELVVAPLTMGLYDLRKMVAGVANDKTIPNNPLKKHFQTKAGSEGLWIVVTVVNNWDAIMAATARDYLASGLPTVSLNNGETCTAYLMPSQDVSDNLNMSYRQMKQKGLTTVTIPGYIAYQMKRIQQGQKPIDASTYTWVLGEFTDSSGGAYAPNVAWGLNGRVRVERDGVDDSGISLGVRSPVG